MPSLSELLRPIPGPNPSGEDVRYTGIYDLIKEARREEPDLPQGDWTRERKVADWPAVVDLCTDALMNKTKDLQIAAWLTEALVHRDGFPGLRQGLNLLRDLVDQFWSTVYPRSEEDELEFRAGPLEWVGSRLDVAVKSVPLTQLARKVQGPPAASRGGTTRRGSASLIPASWHSGNWTQYVSGASGI